MLAKNQVFVSPEHVEAIQWAERNFEASRLEPVSDHTWASTYRLVGPTGTSYLKVVPEIQREQLRRVMAVSEKLHRHVPRVIAAECNAGWILTAEHGGQEPDLDDDDDQLLPVVRRYAALQCEVTGSRELLGMLDTVDLAAMPQAVLDFLAEAALPAAAGRHVRAGAAYFIGPDDASRYLRLLAPRVRLLEAFVARAGALPVTISHGDLHPWNVAIRPGGEVVFFDWDDVAAGPAGLCMHGLFSGSAYAAALLHRMATQGATASTPEGLRLQAYVDALVDGGYASSEALLHGLGGAMCAGQIRFILSFGRYPGEKVRSAAGGTLRARLSDLLDLCDWLASLNPAEARASADAYQACGEFERAQRIVQDQLARGPQTAELLAHFGRLSHAMGAFDNARQALAEALQLQPGNAALLVDLARTRVATLELDAAQGLIDQALAQAPGLPAAMALQQRVTDWRAVLAAAARPDGLPRVALTDEERAQDRLQHDTRAMILSLFRTHGVVQIDGAFEPERIQRLRDAFLQRNEAHFYEGDHPDALKVGDKRYMLTMELDALFGDPDFIASPLLMPLMHAVLTEECILSGYAGTVSLPGSDDQWLHKDHSPLFEELGWNVEQPVFTAQFVVPLVPLDAVTGATRVFKGSQRVDLDDCEELPHQDPVMPLGSCLMMDYSVAHHGMRNRSDRVRPILNLVYSRPWFRDCRNYDRQPPLRFSQAYFDQAPPRVRELVGWWDLERRAAAQAHASMLASATRG